VGSQPWFFAPPDSWRGSEIELQDDESHHAIKVLHVAPPDIIAVTDGAGSIARCAARRIEDGRLVVEVLERKQHRRPPPELVVYQGAAKGHKIDATIERLAELGVAETCVYQSSRAVVRWDGPKIERLGERWESIARAAVKLSRGAWLMRTAPGVSWAELLERVRAEPCAVVLWEKASLPLRTALLDATERVGLVVGPEGGLAQDEAEALADAGGQLVSLGPRILRTENAAAVGVAAIMFHYGLIG
jgi:16S rRNA (uracil1498-N3)-methyltransferase